MLRLATEFWRVLALTVVGTVVAMLPTIPRSTSAAPLGLTIRSVTITNVTDSSFTVSWVTDQPQNGGGAINFGTNPSSLGSKATEPISSGRGSDVHSITVRALNQSTTYYFSISDADAIEPDSGYVFEVTTGASLPALTTNRRVTGKVQTSDGQAAVGVLVTVRVLDNANLNGPSPTTSAPLSTLTDSSGAWSIILTPRTSDSSNFFNFTTDRSDALLVTVEGGVLGVVYPAQTVPIQFNGTAPLEVPTSVLHFGTIPAVTPVAIEPTSTTTPTATATAPATPPASATPTPSISVSPRPSEFTPTATPTRRIVIPTVAPVPTQVEPPPEITTRPSPAPTSAPVNPPASGVPTAATLGTPALAALPSEPSRVAESVRPSPRVTPHRETPSPTATKPSATPAVGVAPSGSSTGDTSPNPLQSLTLVLVSGLGLIGLGLVLSVAGIVDQRRDG